MRKLLTGILAAGLCVAAGSVSAQVPDVRLSWDNCDPIVLNKDFNLPTDSYKIIISGDGFDGTFQGNEFQITIAAYDFSTTPLVDSWHFESGGCNAGQFSASTAGLTKACPAFEGARPLPLTQFAINDARDPINTARIQGFNAFDPFVATGATRYTMWQLIFNHAFTVVGPSDPAVACGLGEKPVCFILRSFGVLDATNTVIPVVRENSVVTWNDPTNPGGRCPATPVLPTTWGQIKNTYR
jgi:hypothetical protein